MAGKHKSYRIRTFVKQRSDVFHGVLHGFFICGIRGKKYVISNLFAVNPGLTVTKPGKGKRGIGRLMF